MSTRYFGLDVLRALAVIGVLCRHALECTTGVPAAVIAVCARGWAGVDLFFVLSGFLIGGQFVGIHEQEPFRSELRNFWVKRWSRTLPLYFTVLAVYVFVKPVAFHAPFVGHPWMFCIFIQNFFPLRDFVQSWSLCIEEQFYLVLPLIMLRVRPRAWALLVPAALSVAIRAAVIVYLAITGHAPLTVPEHETVFRFNSIAHLDGLSIGLFLAATKPTWMRFSAFIRSSIAVGGLVLLTVSLVIFPYQPYGVAQVVMFLFLSVGFGAALIGVHSMRRASAIAPLVEKMALWSYGAYLWNNLLLRYLVHHPVHAGWWIEMLVFIGGSFALAALTYYAIEKPGLRLRRWAIASPN